MPRRRLFPFVVIALAVLAAPGVSGAITSHSTSTLRAHDASLAAKSRAAVLGLYSLDLQLAGAQSQLNTLQTQTQSLRAQRASLGNQLRIAKHGATLAQARVAARLRALYEQGNVEPLEIVFGAKTIDEAMTSLDNLSRMTSQGEELIGELKTARVSLGSASRRLASREVALAAALQQARSTGNALAATRAARTSYIGSLAAERKLTQRQISSLVTQAGAAQSKSAQLTRASSVGSSTTGLVSSSSLTGPAVAASGGGRTLTVSATGYALAGTTATGLPVGWGIVAVDPSMIPLGTKMTIPGYGEAVAADTGGAIIGTTIDLWFPSVAQANAWGRRTVTITLH